MAHPPAQQPNFNNNETGEIDEVLPPPHMPLKMSRDLIHFDIDPTNGKRGAVASLRGMLVVAVLSQALMVPQSW